LDNNESVVTIEEGLECENQLVESKWGHVEDWLIAGNGEVTNPDKDDPKACGKFYGIKGCLNVEGHNKTTLDGVNHKGMMYGRKQFRYCNNPRCPTCHDHGWGAREARKAEARLLKGKKRFGQIEHITVSPPIKGYDWLRNPEKERIYRRTRLRRILDKHGIMGGLVIFHPARYANARESAEKGVPFGWYFSPHYHIVGFIKNGYSRCRGCKYNNKYDRDRCRACKGFEGRVRRLNAKHGFIVKVLGERKSIWGTVYYQLDHCGVTVENSGYHNVTWFGVVSYCALKLIEDDFVEVGFKHNLCPICQEPLEDLYYLGSDYYRFAEEFWVKEFEEPFLDKDGKPRWKIKEKSAWREVTRLEVI